MAAKCDFCKKGIQYGHAVSHAKNRTRRIFKPNLQKLKVLKNGVSVRVKFCTSCIKRLKKDGRLGNFLLRKFTPGRALAEEKPSTFPIHKVAEKVKIKKASEEVKKEKVKEEKAKATLKIEEIVGKKSR